MGIQHGEATVSKGKEGTFPVIQKAALASTSSNALSAGMVGLLAIIAATTLGISLAMHILTVSHFGGVVGAVATLAAFSIVGLVLAPRVQPV